MTHLKLTTAVVALAAFSAPAFAELDNTSAKSEAIMTQGEKTYDVNGEPPVEDNARLEAVTPSTEGGSVAESELPDNNARQQAVTGEGGPVAEQAAEDDTFMTADSVTAEQLEGARVYDANNNWIGEVSAVRTGSAIIDVGGFLGIGEKPVEIDFAQLDILQEEGSDDIRVFTKVTEAELEAMPSYRN